MDKTNFTEREKQIEQAKEDEIYEKFTKEPANALLINALRYCNKEQLIALTDALIERCDSKKIREAKLEVIEEIEKLTNVLPDNPTIELNKEEQDIYNLGAFYMRRKLREILTKLKTKLEGI